MPARVSRGIALPSLEKRWSIGIYEGADPLALQPAAGVANPVMTARLVTDVRARFVADPFMVRHAGTWHMFFEVFRADVRKGAIGMATSPDGFAWTYRQIVLNEPFHLSYPYVFAWNSELYMIPETSGLGEVRLYRASAFPGGWQFERTLLSGAGFTDASIVRHDDRWWLFASLPGDATLSVFHAASLDAAWIPHARNPILRHAPDRARPAGRIIAYQDRLLRPAQDNRASYGMAVNACEITQLTTAEYAERPARPSPLLAGSGSGWNARGMHHVDAHETAPGRWLACVDGFRKSWVVGYRRWPEPPPDSTR
jgi:hypothetical protein